MDVVFYLFKKESKNIFFSEKTLIFVPRNIKIKNYEKTRTNY